MTRPARWFATLSLVLAASISHGATPAAHAPPPPQIHYTMSTHKFAVADPGRSPDERSMARDVEWSYPVFVDARDPATTALNTWARRESLKLLFGELHGEDRLTDAEIVAKAVASQDFVDSGIDQAVMRPNGALGRYRDLVAYGEMVGGNHPYHTLAHHLFSLDRRDEVELASLFKPDDDGVLDELYAAQPESACPGKSFGWDQASLSDVDTLSFEYPYEPGRNVDGLDCMFLAIQGPKVTQLLKSPRSLRPRYLLVEDPS